jgi:membrane protease YdiL (CAAX protease family)
LDIRKLFFTDAGALRAPWRLFLFFAASLVASMLAEAFAAPVLMFVFHTIGVGADSSDFWIELIGLAGGTAFMLFAIDKRSWRDVWLGRDAFRARAITFGFGVGMLAIGLPILSLIAGHWLRNDGARAGSWWGAAARVTTLLLPAALVEELLTRGYLLSVLKDVFGWAGAIGITSVGFGLLHLKNNSVGAGSTALVIIAGVFIATVLYATQSLYAAWMAHFAWNWTMAVIFHTAVSGWALESPRYRYVDAGPNWATGGDWGPEGGIPAGLGMVGGIGLSFFTKRRGQQSRLVHQAHL